MVKTRLWKLNFTQHFSKKKKWKNAESKNVPCSFVVQKSATESDVLKTKWLPVGERSTACVKWHRNELLTINSRPT